MVSLQGINILIAAGLLLLPFVSLEIGYRAGRAAKAGSAATSGAQVGAIQGAILGLLGLLLAFSFSSAGSRFLDRQDLIVQEANAIGTTYLRAELLPDPHRTALRSALRDYTTQRISISPRLAAGLLSSDAAEIERLHTQIWQAAIEGVRAQPDAMLGVLPPVNETIDLHATRLAAGRKHLPAVVAGLLVACSALAMGVIGYGCGMGDGQRRSALTTSLAIIIFVALWTTYDFDHPRSGLMRLNDAPLKALNFDGPSK